MALQFSTAYRNARLRDASIQDMFEGGELTIWTGSAPATADLAASGTRLVTVTLGSATRTPETTATGIVNLTGGGSGTVDTMTVDGYDILGGAVNFNGSLAQTAADVATAINKFTGGPIKVWATSSGADITIHMAPGTGDSLNGTTLACTSSTITNTINGGSSSTIGGTGATAGVDAANGITFGEPSGGAVSKTGTWSGVCDNTGTAGYFRLEGVTSPTDTSGLDSSPYIYYRIQGTCGTTGADYNMSSTSLSSGSSHTVDTFTLTDPAS